MAANNRDFNQNLVNAHALESSQEQTRHVATRLEVIIALNLRCKCNAKKRSTAIEVNVRKDASKATKVMISKANLKRQ